MRTFNRIASVLLAIVLFVAGAALAVESLMIALGRPPVLVSRDGWYAALSTTRPDQPIVLVIALIALVAGLLLLFGQLRPWRPNRLAARGGWRVQRRAAQRSVAAAVNRVPSVTGAKARLLRHWKVRVRATGDASDRDAVRSAVVRELDRLAAKDSPRIRVRLVRRRVV